jgi:hypothetical protein
MTIPRGLYIMVYIIYLIFLELLIWYLIYYSVVPYWVWFFFLTAIIFAMFNLFIWEYYLKKVVDGDGDVVNSQSLKDWNALYVIFHLFEFILIIIGIGYTIYYSNIEWWLWLMLGLYIILTKTSLIIIRLSNGSVSRRYTGIFIFIVAYILYTIAFIILAQSSKCPWWVDLILGFTYFFSILSTILEYKSKPYQITNVKVENTKKCVSFDDNDDEIHPDEFGDDLNVIVYDNDVENVKEVIRDNNLSVVDGDNPSNQVFDLVI